MNGVEAVVLLVAEAAVLEDDSITGELGGEVWMLLLQLLLLQLLLNGPAKRAVSFPVRRGDGRVLGEFLVQRPLYLQVGFVVSSSLSAWQHQPRMPLGDGRHLVWFWVGIGCR